MLYEMVNRYSGAELRWRALDDMARSVACVPEDCNGLELPAEEKAEFQALIKAKTIPGERIGEQWVYRVYPEA